MPSDFNASVWEAPPAKGGSPEELAVWAQLIAGIELDDGGAVRPLSAEAWHERRKRANP